MGIQYAFFLYGQRIGLCVFCLAISSYVYAIALSKTVKGNLFPIHRTTHAKADQSILFEQITEFLKLHSEAKRLNNNLRLAIQFFLVFHHFFHCPLLFFQSDQPFFGCISTFCYDSVRLEFDHNLRSTANDSNDISSVYGNVVDSFVVCSVNHLHHHHHHQSL